MTYNILFFVTTPSRDSTQFQSSRAQEIGILPYLVGYMDGADEFQFLNACVQGFNLLNQEIKKDMRRPHRQRDIDLFSVIFPPDTSGQTLEQTVDVTCDGYVSATTNQKILIITNDLILNVLVNKLFDMGATELSHEDARKAKKSFLSKCSCCNLPGCFSCSTCKSTNYCSKDCQKNHWKKHKPDCKPKKIDESLN